jgi:hypothetical protein
MMVEGYLKEEVGGSIPGNEISSLPDGKLAKWSIASCALAFNYRTFVSKEEKRKKKKKKKNPLRNIIHIHNNVLWDWQYSMKYSLYSC